ncbi:unnamed protein product [Prorocentrum cordatum]|uniref:Uncharacterized protein n=1 Tax=Prorocentrum cordatum TaxID=2364126 RepID=A0ABN9SQ84_9DINO|nr:unnamed protein product [Polarella glacialis]
MPDLILRGFKEPRTSAPDGLDDFKQHFVGTVPLQATDLYFSLLVYKMKPEFPSILAIFEQVISAPDMKYIVWDEWKRLILSNSMTFKDSVIHDMWLVMDFQRSGRVSLTDFIAAWHVHDVEISDPWIAQLAGTLRLDYYGMSAEEVQERLRGWDGRLDLAESGADTGLERLDAHSRRTDGRAETEDLPVQKAHRKALLDRVSLNETEYHEVGGSEDGDSDASLQSFELSEWSDEEVAFDAQAIRHRQREAENAMNSDLHKRRIIVDSDAAMKKLMELPPDEFNRQRDLQGMGEALALKQQAKKSNDTTFGGSSGVDAGAGVGNDTFAVRQSLREVYRSMPMPDFLGLVNLLLRGLQTIKHSQFNNDTYWHVRNPAFAHAMGTEGTNMYTRRLLMQMGFALINETYWVWPSAHLDMKATSSWGVCEVPYDCAGREPRRLDDMIELLKNCQKELRQNSTQFNGHFKITRE